MRLSTCVDNEDRSGRREAMLLDDRASRLAEAILARKIELENGGLKPRLVLLGEEAFGLLEQDWLEAAAALPWGDSLIHELRMRRAQRGGVFLGDGSMFGLWVVKVATIDGFQVF
jgi:hypothetical protein